MATVNMERVSRVLDALEEKHPGAQLLVNDPWSIYYLTGFYADMYERFSGVLLERGKRPVIYDNVLYPIDEYDNADIVYFEDTDDTIEVIKSRLDPSRPLGVDVPMRSGFLLPLVEAGAASEFFLGTYAVTASRSVKDPEEQRLMKEASLRNDATMCDVRDAIHEGVTEAELEHVLAKAYKTHGCTGYCFEPIISFGEHASDPHHAPDDTRLTKGTHVLIDVGSRYHGYCSDMTRDYFLGEPDPETLKIYDIVKRANEAAEAIIKPGVRFCDIDKTARDIITDAGYGKYFTHRLGHSIGLQDHEPGDCSSVNTDTVKPGNTFSIEPGIYLPGRTGIRIEDLVLVTEDGVEIMNKLTKDVVRID